MIGPCCLWKCGHAFKFEKCSLNPIQNSETNSQQQQKAPDQQFTNTATNTKNGSNPRPEKGGCQGSTTRIGIANKAFHHRLRRLAWSGAVYVGG